MKLSTRARYALQAMLAIAKLTDGTRPVNLGQVAENTQLSRRYLEQLVVSLRNAVLLRSVSGRGGGYLLARSPADIKIRSIIEAAIGPISIVDCVKQPDACMKSDLCDCRTLYGLVNRRIEQALDEFSLADMTGGVWRETVERHAAHTAAPLATPASSSPAAIAATLDADCPQAERPEARA